LRVCQFRHSRTGSTDDTWIAWGLARWEELRVVLESTGAQADNVGTRAEWNG